MNNTNTTGKTGLKNMMTETAIKEKYLKGNNVKILAAKAATVLMIIIALIISNTGFGLGFTKKDAGITVYDKKNILSVATTDAIEARNDLIVELTKDKEAKIIVVVESGRNSYNDLKKKTDKLFKNYKAGDNGMLFSVTIPDSDSNGWGASIEDFFDENFGGGTQPYAYHKGRNLDEVEFSDDKIDVIFAEKFLTSREAEKYNAAVLDTFNALADRFDEYYKIDSKINVNITEEESSSAGSNAYISIIGVIALFGVLFIILGLFTGKRKSGTSKVYKRPFWFDLF